MAFWLKTWQNTHFGKVTAFDGNHSSIIW